MTAHKIRKEGLSLFLGAGASMDLGFPSGEQLKNRIRADLVCPKETALGKLVGELFSRTCIRDFTAALTTSGALSIDEIVRRNQEKFSEIGQLVVWFVILEHERKVAPSRIETFWFYRLLDRLFEESRTIYDLDQHGSNGTVYFLHNLVIHTLNYDRMAEHTIHCWLKKRYPGADLKQYAMALNPGGLIRHHHGSLGPLTGEDSLPFGACCPTNAQQILKRSSRLQFWFEPNNNPEAYSITNRIIELRGIHIILGFGYHEMIGSRFAPPGRNDVKLNRVIATQLGLVHNEAAPWLQKTYGNFGVQVQLLDPRLNCAEAVKRLFLNKL